MGILFIAVLGAGVKTPPPGTVAVSGTDVKQEEGGHDLDLELVGQACISAASGITSSHDDSVIYAADVAPWQLRE